MFHNRILPQRLMHTVTSFQDPQAHRPVVLELARAIILTLSGTMLTRHLLFNLLQQI